MRDTKEAFIRPLRLRWNRPLNLPDARLILTGLRHPNNPTPEGPAYRGAHIIIATRTDTRTIEPHLGDNFHAAGTLWHLYTILTLPNGEPVIDLISQHPPTHRKIRPKGDFG